MEEIKSNDDLCGENENFIQTKFGYCFYTLDSPAFIYGLYIHPQYRRRGHSKILLKFVISAIRESGYTGEIHIEAEPEKESIGIKDLIRYYEQLGLVVDNKI